MICNAEVQKALTLAGGRRLNGEPNYKFVWSADFTYLISNGKRYEPFRVVAEDCWLLVKYELPEFWGSQAEWEANNWEDAQSETVVDGIITLEPLYTAGPYPSQGRYRNLMRVKRRVELGGVTAYVDAAPSLDWVRDVFPHVLGFQELTTEQKGKLLAQREKDEKESTLKAMVASRELYRGAGTAKQIKGREEAIERLLNDPEQMNIIQNMNKRRV